MPRAYANARCAAASQRPLESNIFLTTRPFAPYSITLYSNSGLCMLGDPPQMRRIVVFTGSAHPDLAESVCSHLGVPLSPTTINRFSNGCLQVQLNENCREADVFIIQPLVPPVHDHLMELLQMLDAARGASASRVTAVIPYFGYARSDQKDAPRISIAGRLTADLLARIHRRRASGQCPEAARGCSCESGIMVLEQQSRPQNKEHPIDATTQPSRSHPNRV